MVLIILRFMILFIVIIQRFVPLTCPQTAKAISEMLFQTLREGYTKFR